MLPVLILSLLGSTASANIEMETIVKASQFLLSDQRISTSTVLHEENFNDRSLAKFVALPVSVSQISVKGLLYQKAIKGFIPNTGFIVAHAVDTELLSELSQGFTNGYWIMLAEDEDLSGPRLNAKDRDFPGLRLDSQLIVFESSGNETEISELYAVKGLQKGRPLGAWTDVAKESGMKKFSSVEVRKDLSGVR